jgi:uncharacterized damage-inducible protein DinB
MDLLDRLLAHDRWTTRQLLDICATFSDAQLDREFDIGRQTLRATFIHVIRNMEIWSALMAQTDPSNESDQSVSGLIRRLDAAADRLAAVSRSVADRNAWDDQWLDTLDDPPCEKSYGTAIAHILTHSMHHRAQVLYMLRLSGVTNLPEGDVFSWENASQPEPPHGA